MSYVLEDTRGSITVTPAALTELVVRAAELSCTTGESTNATSKVAAIRRRIKENVFEFIIKRPNRSQLFLCESLVSSVSLW